MALVRLLMHPSPRPQSQGHPASPLSDGRTSRISSPLAPVQQLQGSTQSHFLALVRLVVDLNRRLHLRTDYEVDQRLEAAGSLLDVVEALALIPRSSAPREDELSELRDDVASLEARMAAFEASLRREVDLRLKAERLCNQASHERNAALDNLRRLRLDHADVARQLVATNIALEQSSQTAAALEQRCRRLDKSLAAIHKVVRQDLEHFKAGIASYATQLRQLREYLEQSERQSSVSGGASAASACGAAATSGSSASVDTDVPDDSGPVISSTLHKGKGKRPGKFSAKPQSAPPPPKKKQRLGRPSVDLKARKAAQQAASAAANRSGAPLSPRDTSVSAAGADGAAFEASDAAGGVFSTPVVSQPRRDGRSNRAASTTAGLRSLTAAENEAAADALVPGLTTPSSTPANTQAFMASSAFTPDPAELAAVAAAASAGILNARIPQPIASDRVTEYSVAGNQAFADSGDPTHPWQRLQARFPESPCTFGADDYMPDKPISIPASGIAIVFKLWRQFTGRAVGRAEHLD
ncbi:unnamed protein product [Phytophthora fragariaefolia]|uniref:Unnamed protein product n=1 Tax=Phytophthora fragariaefolia TaxID=1490495 RepID=A0A9W6X6E8_9STRA|nr:unnamed protein product [Phytophthora fragariaefolia]